MKSLSEAIDNTHFVSKLYENELDKRVISIHIHSARCAMDLLGLYKREYISVLTRADIYSRFW